MLEINWVHDGRQPIIPVSILAPAPATDLTAVEAAALVDTGSTVSGITSEIATQLGLTGIGKRPLVSARSEDQAERLVFRVGLKGSKSGDAPAYPYIFEETIGFELKNGFRFDALIGMDILRQCDFSIKRDGSFRLAFGY